MPKLAGEKQTETQGLQIDIRSRPTQARSQETFDRILYTAAELLDEVGYEGFNTNLLAERAGVRVSAIYRYFPNKLSVICTLADQIVAEWNIWFEEFYNRLEQGGDPKDLWEFQIEKYLSSIRKVPGGVAIRRAMKAHPELYQIDQEDSRMQAERMAEAVCYCSPGLTKAEARTASTVLIESAVPVLDMALETTPRKAKQLISALKIMHFNYMDHLLNEKRLKETVKETGGSTRKTPKSRARQRA